MVGETIGREIKAGVAKFGAAVRNFDQRYVAPAIEYFDEVFSKALRDKASDHTTPSMHPRTDTINYALAKKELDIIFHTHGDNLDMGSFQLTEEEKALKDVDPRGYRKVEERVRRLNKAQSMAEVNEVFTKFYENKKRITERKRDTQVSYQ